MSDNEHNGYKNFETWCLMLWIKNEKKRYHYWISAARKIDDVYELSQMLEDSFENNAPELGENVYGDLLGYALRRIDWFEAAQKLIDMSG